MSVQSVLRGCHEALRQSARQHQLTGDAGHASMCSLQAEAVTRLLEELEKEEEK